MTGRFEEALAVFQAEIAAAAKSLGIIKTSLGRASKAAEAGHVRDIDKALAALSSSGAEFARRLTSAQTAWRFDADGYLSSGAFKDELLAAAAAAGLKLFERDGRIYCYPMLLGVSAKDLAVTIDRKPERRLRPSALVKLLAARQRQPQKFAVAQFLETLFAAYRLLAPRFDKAWTATSDGAGPVVPLAEIHETLTLLPGAARDYPLAEFTRDVHLLDRQPETRTRDGRRFTLPNSTGSKGGKRLTMADEQGGERVYVGLAFHKEA
ncbi:MAG: hypothetical protein IT548_16840 [Alphaproteobacteria bacterium]|nr:hypothetical protein [Alphaproteobacteria bacterium]